MVMNKYWYDSGNVFKAKFRTHNCYKCGGKLVIAKHRKVVDQKSEEAKYYDFDAGGDGGIMVGSCEFIHKVFYCPTCLEQFEFVTQLSFEDIDIFMKKLKHKFSKKAIDLEMKKSYELKTGTRLDKVDRIEDVQNLYLTGYDDGKELFIYKIPMGRKSSWERPYFFKIAEKKLIKSIDIG